MELLQEYMGVLTSAIVAAGAAAFARFFWKRMNSLLQALRDAEARGDSDLPERLGRLEQEVRELKATAYDAITGNLSQREAGEIADQLRRALAEDFKAFHKRLANALSTPAPQIDLEKLTPLREELNKIHDSARLLNDPDVVGPVYVYRDEVFALIEMLCRDSQKGEKHYALWQEITDSAEVILELIDRDFSDTVREKLKAFNIRTGGDIQTWKA